MEALAAVRVVPVAADLVAVPVRADARAAAVAVLARVRPVPAAVAVPGHVLA